ncbi:MAG: fimbrial biogenesis chaperone [Desulfuromonadales bacterium]
MNPAFHASRHRRGPVFALLFLAALGLPASALAGWAVAPIRVELSAQSRTETVSVSNDGDTTVQFDVEPRRWTQDDSGQDLYQVTEDLVVFPRMLSVPSKETRVIRIGLKAPAGPVEKAYRVFIREKPREKSTQGTTVNILINFGVPVFSRPANPQSAAQVTAFGIRDGILMAEVHNTGNIIFQFRSITLRGVDTAGNELFNEVLGGGYLLSGSRRDFPLKFPAEACPRLSRITATFHSDTLELEQSTGADAALCSQ